MAESDRTRWDRAWGERTHAAGEPPAWLDTLNLPHQGTALDVAAGAGRVALWLATRGLRVTAADVSPVGLERAERSAREQELDLDSVVVDLERAPLPPGPGAGWHVVTCFHYLQRSLFPSFAEALRPGGWLCCEIATRRNLERHAKPSARFLLEEGELASLVDGALEVVHCSEDWHDDRHLARLAARRPAAARSAV